MTFCIPRKRKYQDEDLFVEWEKNSFYFLLVREYQLESQSLYTSILSIVFISLHYHRMRVKNYCQRNTGMQVAK